MRTTILGMIQSAKTSYQSTILLATSRMSVVESLADRIAVMIHGSLHFIGTEQQLRRRHCKQIQISIKMKPAKSHDMLYAIQLRKAIPQTFSRIRMQMAHNYFVQYYIREHKKQETTALAWSTIFERLEQLRARFDLESYTVTFGNLEQIFYTYIKKYADQENITKNTVSSHRG